MGDKENKRKKKSTGLGLAVWILAFLILVIVFLVKSEEIKDNIQKTRFFERAFGKTPSFLVKSEPAAKEKTDDVQTEIKKKEETPAAEVNVPQKKETEEVTEPERPEKTEKVLQKEKEVKTEVKKEEPEIVQVPEKKEVKKVPQKKEETAVKKAAEKANVQKEDALQEVLSQAAKKTAESAVKTAVKTAEKPAETASSNTITAKICFVAISNDGPIIRKEVRRQVEKSSPLTESINSLLNGPGSQESSTGCRSLIPPGTKLYSASVKDGVATLNFSEEFEFNQYGVEGYLGQLMQVVYTATNFSTVQSVQILISGQKLDYLGSEGVWIGSPLSRASFR